MAEEKISIPRPEDAEGEVIFEKSDALYRFLLGFPLMLMLTGICTVLFFVVLEIVGLILGVIPTIAIGGAFMFLFMFKSVRTLADWYEEHVDEKLSRYVPSITFYENGMHISTRLPGMRKNIFIQYKDVNNVKKVGSASIIFFTLKNGEVIKVPRGLNTFRQLEEHITNLTGLEIRLCRFA